MPHGRKKKVKMETDNIELYPVALTIAGSDSGGGAGIQADLRTFSAFGVYGCSVITAVTAQNPHEVSCVEAVSTNMVKAQLEAVLSAFNVDLIKIGMLHNADIIKTVCSVLSNFDIPIILDPVMISTSGHQLLEDVAVECLKNELLPMASWVTPNKQEAEVLVEAEIDSVEKAVEVAKELSERWACGCILKGGHMDVIDGQMIDVVSYQDTIRKLCSPCVDNSKATHGTGCTFSSAFAASLALGNIWQDALKDAKGFVYGSLLDAVVVGGQVEAMYPPLKNYSNKIKLEKVRLK